MYQFSGGALNQFTSGADKNQLPAQHAVQVLMFEQNHRSHSAEYADEPLTPTHRLNPLQKVGVIKAF